MVNESDQEISSSTLWTLSPNMSLNTTFSNSTVERDESLARAEIVVQSVVLVLAVLGNSIVLTSLFLRRKSLTRMHVLMIHLSLADLFVAFCSVLPQLAWDVTFVFKGGDFLCRLVKYMQVVAIYASSYVLLTTAIDRYLAICHPFLSHKWPSTMVHKLVLTAWIFSLLFSIPQVFIFSTELNQYGYYDCWATFDPPWTMPLYITTFTFLVYIIPTIILVFCYSNICLAVWKSGKIELKQKRTAKSMFTSNASYRVRESTEIDSKIFTTDDPNDIETKRSPIVKTGFTFKARFKPHTNTTSVSNKESHSSKVLNSDMSLRQNSDNNFQCATKPVGVRNSLEDTTFCNQTRNSSPLTSETIPAHEERRKPHGSGISRAKLKTIKLTMTVVICYLACWTPFFIAQMWAVYDVNAPFDGSAYTIILLLASLNSCTNPWIYLIYSDMFYTCFKTVFSRLPQK